MSVGGGRRGCRPGARTAGGSALFVSTRCGRLPRPLAPSHPSWHLFCLPGGLRAAPPLQGSDPLLPGSRRPGRLYALWLSLGLGLAPLVCTRWGFRCVSVSSEVPPFLEREEGTQPQGNSQVQVPWGRGEHLPGLGTQCLEASCRRVTPAILKGLREGGDLCWSGHV